MSTHDDIEQLAAAIANAWEQRDPEKAAQIFVETVEYYESPFSRNYASTKHGVRDLWREVQKQERVRVVTNVHVFADSKACIEYTALYLLNGDEIESRGVWLVELEAGACRRFKMYSAQDSRP